MDSGNEMDSEVLWKKSGGRLSGPAAELVLSFFRIPLTMVGLIVTSLIPDDVGGMRLGKCGRLLSSSVHECKLQTGSIH